MAENMAEGVSVLAWRLHFRGHSNENVNEWIATGGAL